MKTMFFKFTLKKKGKIRILKILIFLNFSPDVAKLAVDGTENDLLLAQMLQLEFDKENDEYVKAIERQQKGDSKGLVNF